MGKLFERIRAAVDADSLLHGTRTSVVKSAEFRLGNWLPAYPGSELVRERPRSKPNPSIVVRQLLLDGTKVEVVWSWISTTDHAKLVTVYLVE